MTKFFTRFNPPTDPGIACTLEESRTKPEFEAETNINNIMARYKKTGKLPESAMQSAARFGDFSQVPDFMEMQNRVLAAHDLFMALPAAVRRQFDNDPGQFIAASDTQEGRELMVKLGLGAAPKPSGEPDPGSLRSAPEPTSSSKGKPAKAAQTAPKGAQKEESGQDSE